MPRQRMPKMKALDNSINMSHLREAVTHLSRRGQLIVALRNDRGLNFAEIDRVLSLAAGESEAAYAGILQAIKGYLNVRRRPVPKELPSDDSWLSRDQAGNWSPEV